MFAPCACGAAGQQTVSGVQWLGGMAHLQAGASPQLYGALYSCACATAELQASLQVYHR